MAKKPAAWTAASVLNLRPGPDKLGLEATMWHPTIHRFGIRFRRPDRAGAWGKGTYTAVYTRSGRDHPVAIGKVGGMELEAAEAEALKVGTQVKQNLNPAIERARAKDVRNDLFKGLVPDFLAHLARNRRTTRYIATTERYLTKCFPGLCGLRLTDISRRECADALRRVLDRGPAAADQARSALSAYFAWLRGEGRVDNNPVDGTNQREAPPTRDRTLTEGELRVVWNAIENTRTGRLFRLLILTGSRRDQIGELRKEWLDLDGAVPAIRFPGKGRAAVAHDIRGGSKHGQPFVLPLSRQAVAILREQLAETPADVPNVFGQRGQANGFSGYSKALEALQARCGDKVAPWTLHDLRRTFASLGFEKVGQDPLLLDACLNHIPSFKRGVAGIYQRAQLVEARVPVVQAWADYCDSLTAPAAPRLHLIGRAA